MHQGEDAVAEVPGRRAQLVVAAVIGALLMIGAATVFAVQGASGDVGGPGAAHPIAVQLPRPATITRHGVTYRVKQVGLLGVLRDSSHARRLRVPVFDRDDPQDPRCGQVSTSAQLVRETTASVTIATFAYAVPTGSSGRKICAFATVQQESLYAEHVISLSRPIGRRRVIDARTGEVVSVLDPRLVKKPDYVPAGYRLTQSNGFSDESGYAALRRYANGSDSIEISARSAGGEPMDRGKVTDIVTVSGHRATITRERYERCLSWTDEPGLVRAVCSFVRSKSYLPSSELVKIATSLR